MFSACLSVSANTAHILSEGYAEGYAEGPSRFAGKTCGRKLLHGERPSILLLCCG